jgi:putative oxidoreductase
MKTKIIVLWVLQLVSAVIMLQTLFFKFTGAEESIYIFTTVGMEPWGRYGTGIAELIASILLLIPNRAWLGALFGAGLMAGAILSHITFLGYEVKGDGGQLFIYALVVLLSCTTVLFLRRSEIPYLNKFLKTSI